MRAVNVVRVLATCFLVACASAGTPASEGTSRESRNRLTHDQLVSASADNVYDAISKLRPDWLTSRGPSSVTDASPTVASVFMNGNQIGRVESLRDLRVLDVAEVRYWEPGPASARFGMGHPRGVIEITRR